MVQVVLEHNPDIPLSERNSAEAAQSSRAADREAADIARAMQLSE